MVREPQRRFITELGWIGLDERRRVRGYGQQSLMYPLFRGTFDVFGSKYLWEESG